MPLLLTAVMAFASVLPGPIVQGLAPPSPTEAAALRAAAHDTSAYTLPPKALAQASALHRIAETLTLSSLLWTPLQLLLLLSFGWSRRFRDSAERLSRNRRTRTAAYLLLLLLTVDLLDLPFALYGHRVALAYALSVQGWPSWFADKGKGLLLRWLLATPVAVGVLAAIRRAPRRWWLAVWPPAVLFTLAGVLVTPYLVDPLFNHFDPLAQSNPALVLRLQQVVARSGIAIPPERMFRMSASAKVTSLNAYVTGFGPSKRIVVWDTTIAHSTPDQIAYIFAHELGHYALSHVLVGITLSCLALLPLFWLTHLGASALLRRYAARWKLRGLDDLAAIPALLLVLSLLSTLGDPIGNALSRRMEHNADVYAQEALHTILPDPAIQPLGRASFQSLGQTSLVDPTPHPLYDWFFSTHPPIAQRAAFAAAYDPWTPGAAPKYFAKP
ncbi:MAG: M48 family metalloprotease [Acidobacteriota bacterium]|nr:M48 family metalloprotease [Acidobacteriota bacterium]